MREYRFCFFFPSRRRHWRYWRDRSSDVCSSDLGGPSTKPCPRCPPQREQCTSVRVCQKKVRSVEVPTAPSIDARKLGQPVPLSYLAALSNRGRSQPAQWNRPRRFSRSSGLLPARSVACLRSTSNRSGDKRRRHSASSSSTSNRAPERAAAAPGPERPARAAVASRVLRLCMASSRSEEHTPELQPRQ